MKDRTHFEIFRDRSGQYRWRLRADSGKSIAIAGEGYARKEDAEAIVLELIRGFKKAPVQDLTK